MRTFRAFPLAALAPLILGAQPSPADAERRLSFAQTYAGVDWLKAGDQASAPRVTVGGLHFWGHADFFVTFALQRSKAISKGAFESRYSPAGETGANVYPWALTNGTVRPFAGISWSVAELSLRSATLGEGPRQQIQSFPLRAGIGILRAPLMLELMAQYNAQAATRYPLLQPGGQVALQRVDIPRWRAGLSVRYVRDTTRGERANYIDEAERIDDLRRRGAWNTFYGGVGISSALFTRDSEFNRVIRPTLQGGLSGALFPSFHGGYHWADKDVLFNVAYRRMNPRISGWGDQQHFRRAGVTIEAAKLLLDFHGFVPFVGAGVSAESLRFRDEPGSGSIREASATRVRPGFVVGWDIRPSKTIPVLIRTSLRYTPSLSLTSDRRMAPAPDFEFDFFQFVFYPKRLGRR